MRTLILIDFSNLNGVYRSLGKRVLPTGIVKVLSSRYLSAARTQSLRVSREDREVIDAIVYAATPSSQPDGIQRWHDHLRHTGINVMTKVARVGEHGEQRCNFDVEMAVDAMRLLSRNILDEIILVTHDGDFSYLLDEARRNGIHTVVAGHEERISKDLKTSAHEVVNFDLGDRSCFEDRPTEEESVI